MQAATRFATVSPARALTDITRFPVTKKAGRYIVVWIVELPHSSAAELAEVRVRAR